MFDDIKELNTLMNIMHDDLEGFQVVLKETQKDANLQIRSLRRDLLTLNKTIKELIKALKNK